MGRRRWATSSESPSSCAGPSTQLRTGKGGPVLLEVPTNIWTADFQGKLDLRAGQREPHSARPARRQGGRQGPARREKAGHPRRPRGIMYAEATEELQQLAEPIAGSGHDHDVGQERFPGESSVGPRRRVWCGPQTRVPLPEESRCSIWHRLQLYPHQLRADDLARQGHGPLDQ